MIQNLINKILGRRSAPRTRAPRAAGGSRLPRPDIEPGAPPAQGAIDPTASPEKLCGLRNGMTRDDVRRHLAVLYRRHNRAASSLDEQLRQEAEIMLDAIVICRERYLGDA